MANPKERQRVAGLLEPVFESQGAWAELAKVFEVQLEDLTDPTARAGHLSRIGELAETKLKDAELAFAAYRRAVHEDIGDAAARTDLARVTASIDRHQERAALLEKGLASTVDAYVKSELCLELAELWGEAEPDSPAAERAYTRLLEQDADNPDIVLKASRALERIHRVRGDDQALADDLRRQLRFEEDPTRRDELFPQLATLLEVALGEPDSAIEVHEQRRELDPADREVLAELERLYAARGRWEQLVSVLEKQSELGDELEVSEALMLRIGAVYETKLEDAERAIDTYRDGLARFGPHEPTLQALARLYEATSQWEDLLEITELRAGAAVEPNEQIAHRFEAAELMRTRTEDPERAFDIYQELLDRMPGHEPSVGALEQMLKGQREQDASLCVAAAQRLLEHYRACGQYVDQVRMLEVVGDIGDPVERVESLLRAAEVCEIGLEDNGRAFHFTGRALRLGVPSDDFDRVVEGYQRLAVATERFEDCFETLDAIAPELIDGDQRIEVRMQAAMLGEHQLASFELARAQYQHVLDEQPDHGRALDALLALVERKGEPVELVELLRRKTELSLDAEERTELLVRRARLLETKLEDADAAIDCFDRALGEGDHPDAYEALERLYRQKRRWDELAGLYERQIDQHIGEAADVRYALGKLCLESLDDPWRALEQFRGALSEDPEHAATVATLEILLAQEDYRSAAAELLQPLYLRRMDWPKVTGIFEARLDGERDPSQRLDLLSRLGEVQESHLEDLEGALETYGRLFIEEPEDSGSQEKLTRLARALSRWDRLAAIYEQALAMVEVDDENSARLSLTTAALFDERLADPAKAAQYYRRALQYDPSHAHAGTALAAVLTGSKRWDELLELDRERESFAEDDASRLEILHEIARVQVDELEDSAEGIVTLQRVLEIRPSDLEATARLDQLFESLERWDDLAAHLEFQVDNCDDPETRLELRHRLGDVVESRLGDVSRALDLYEDVLADSPNFSKTIASVTRVLEQEDHGPRAVAILESIHRDADEVLPLIEVLEAKARQATDSLEQAEAWREVGQLRETRAEDPERALEAYGAAWVAEPGDSETRAEVTRLAGALGAWPRFVELSDAAVAGTDDMALQVAFLRAVAEAQDEKLGDPRAAIRTLDRVCVLDPEDTDTLDELEGLLVMVGDWSLLASVYERKLEQLHDADQRGGLLLRLGGLFEEQLSDRERAVSHYRRASEERPDDGEALVALDRLFSSANETEQLAEILERRVELESDADERVALGLRLAELYEAQLGRPGAASEALQAVLDTDRDHRGALEGLSRLHERQGEWPELVAVLQRRADAALSDSERVALTHQLGNVMERELDDELSAIAVYGQVLRIDEGHEPSLQALLRITKLADYREDAALVVEPHLRAQERWNDLAVLLRLRADAMSDPHQKAEQLVALADVHEEGRADPNAALEALLQSIGERPDDTEIIDRAETLAGSLQRWQALTDVLYAEAGASLDPESGAALYQRVAGICEHKLNDSTKAIDAYERALGLVGDDPEVLEALDRLFTETERWDRLHEVVGRRLELPGADRPSLVLRQGRLRASRLGDLEGALSLYQQAMEQDPGRDDTLEAVRRLADKPAVATQALDLLEEYYRSEGQLEQVAELYGQRVAMASTDADRVTLLTEAATLYEEELGQTDQAIAALRGAFRAEPRDLALLTSLERLCEQGGRWDDLRGLIEEIAVSGDLDRRELYELRLRSAGWYRDRLDDPKAAERALTDALELDPEPVEAHAARAGLLRDQQRGPELVAALRAWADDEPSVDERVHLLREAATVAHDSLGETELAADCYQALLAADAADLDALRALAEIRRGQERWNEVVGLLEGMLEGTSDRTERAGLAREIGRVYRGHLGDRRAATEAYESALGFDEQDSEAMDALESLYAEGDRLEALRSLLQRRSQLVDREARIELQLRLAKLYEDSFRDSETAIAVLREVLREEPMHPRALDHLERLFELDASWDELVALLLSRVGDAEESEQRALLERVASLHHEKRDDAAAAIQVYLRIQSDLGQDEASLRALATLYEQEQSWTMLADVVERLAGHLDGAEAIALHHRAADLWTDPLDDPQRAARALQVAYQRFPADAATRTRLKAHCEAEGSYAELAQILEDELRVATDDAERLTLLRAISELCRDRLQDPGKAAGYLEQAVALDGDDRDALVSLVDLYLVAARHADAIPVLHRIIEGFGGRRSKELAAHHHRLGSALEATGDPVQALAAYDAAFKIDLTNVAILRDLGKLTHAQGDFDRAQKSFRALLLQKLDDSSAITKADVYYYLGDIAAGQDDLRKACTMLDRALAEDAGHVQAAELLKRLKG